MTGRTIGLAIVPDSHMLVLGAPRSGTSLLAAMIGSHPDIALLNEELSGASLSIFAKPIKGVKLCAPHQIEIDHSASAQGFASVRGKVRRLTNAARKALGRPQPSGGFRKSALSIRDYQAAAERFLVIGIIRSPEQVIASIMRRGNQSRKTAEYRWSRLIEILHQLATEQRAGSEVTIIRFDRLVTHPERTLRDCLKAVGLEFTESVMEGFRHTRQYQGRTEIDPSKAGPGLEADLQHPLLRADPALAAKYRWLHDRAL